MTIDRILKGESIPMKKEQLKILFIGNSHTYYNDMPAMVKGFIEEKGCNCSVTEICQITKVKVINATSQSHQ